MTSDARDLHRYVKERSTKIQINEDKLKRENVDRMSSLAKIRTTHSNIRNVKNDAKENERQKLSRTLMANLVTSADYPDAPDYIPDMINVLKNVLGNVLIFFLLFYIINFIFKL